MQTLKLGKAGLGIITLAMSLACAGLIPNQDKPGGEIESISEAVSDVEATKGSNSSDACRAYIEANNAAACIPVDLDADTICGNLSMPGMPDMTKFYNCRAGISCNGAIPKIPDCSAYAP
jgi:hypothetical protein